MESKGSNILEIKYKKICRLCKIELTNEIIEKNKKQSMGNICKDCVVIEMKLSHDTLKQQVLDTLRNRCDCCYELEPQFLTVDHINGGGSQERKIKSTEKVYKEVIKLGPSNSKYRLLCMNCNFSLGKWNYCPHKIAKEVIFSELSKYKNIRNSIIKVCVDCGIHLNKNNISKNGNLCLSCNHIRFRQRRLQVRIKTIKLYGNKCNCCQESKIEFLTIDHIKGGGHRERQTTKASSSTFYLRITKNYDPTKYQVLCVNCNWAKGIYGVCH